MLHAERKERRGARGERKGEKKSSSRGALLRSRGWSFGQIFQGPSQAAAVRDEADAAEAKQEFLAVAEDAGMHERWQVVLAGRPVAECPARDIRKLMDGGTPLRVRHMLWPRWWGQPKPGEYEDLQKQAGGKYASQIELDLRRTLPSNCTDHQCDSLRRVLNAYAESNPSVGYCQGMSFIAAVPLLLAFTEAEAFMGLRYIVEEVCPDYHGSSLGGYFRDSAVLDALLSQLLPEVHADLVNLDIPFDMLATDHLLTLSSRSWPLEAVSRLWDVVLMEGSSALLASFLALLQTFFPKALANSRAAGLQMDEVPTDVARRFLTLSRKGIASDIDEVMNRTRRFIPLLSGDLARVSPCGKAAFLDKLRAQFSDIGAEHDAGSTPPCTVENSEPVPVPELCKGDAFPELEESRAESSPTAASEDGDRDEVAVELGEADGPGASDLVSDSWPADKGRPEEEEVLLGAAALEAEEEETRSACNLVPEKSEATATVAVEVAAEPGPGKGTGGEAKKPEVGSFKLSETGGDAGSVAASKGLESSRGKQGTPPPASKPRGVHDRHHMEVLVEAQIKISDGSVQLLRVGIIEQPREVAQRFVQDHDLDKSCMAPLAAWLKQVESDAFRYPVKTEGDLALICELQATPRT